MLEVNQRKIKCQTFSAREKLIRKLNHDIWRAARGEPRLRREGLAPGELMNKAHSLSVELDILSDCPKYNQESPGCKICKAIVDLRKGGVMHLTGQTVNLSSIPKEKILCSY